MKKLVLIATITDKRNGNVFKIYRVPASKAGASYEVCIRKGVALNCTCKSRQHRHNVACKHMKDVMLALKPETVAITVGDKTFIGKPAEVVAKAVEVIKPSTITDKGALNGNRGFSLMR